MINYFNNKITEIEFKIENTINNIISSARELNVKSIIDRTQKLDLYQVRRSELIKDMIDNCTVNEIVEYSTKGDSRLNRYMNIEAKDLHHGYKYNKAVTVSDRDLLVKTFGYRFNDIKIK